MKSTKLQKKLHEKGILFTFCLILFGICLLLIAKQKLSPSNDITVGPATNLDISHVLEILTTSRNTAYFKFLSEKSAAYMLDPKLAQVDFTYLAKAFAHHKAHIGVARTAYNNPVGFILTRQLTDNIAFIDFLFVLPEYQNKKIGKKLIKYAIEYTQQTYPRTQIIEVETHKTHPQAMNFYQKQGFSIIKEYPEEDYIVCIFYKMLTPRIGQNSYLPEFGQGY